MPMLKDIFKETTRPFDTVLREELEAIAAARKARKLYRPSSPSSTPTPVSTTPRPAGNGAKTSADSPQADAAPQPSPEAPSQPATASDAAQTSLLKKVADSLSKGTASILRLFFGQEDLAKPALPPPEPLQRDLVGLAISGGGIRSATLSLGILQGLAAKGLLKHLDYLSTVSGGGYIGSWLVSWIRRTAGSNTGANAAFGDVAQALNPKSSEAEAGAPIHHLRRYSNYLTPDLSPLSADTWTLAAIWTRNTLLNMAIVVFGIAVFLLLPRFAGYSLLRIPVSSQTLGIGFWTAAFLLLTTVIAVWNIASNLSRASSGKVGGAGQWGVQYRVVIPLLFASATIAQWKLRMPALFVEQHWLWGPTLVLTLLYTAVAWLGGFPQCVVEQHRPSWLRPPQDLRNLPKPQRPQKFLWLLFHVWSYIAAVLASALSGLLAAVLLHGLALLWKEVDGDWRIWATLSAGPPLILVTLALGMILQIGLMGHDLREASREWLGRLRAWTLIYSAAWLLLTGISIYGPFVLYWAGSGTSLSIGAVWSAISAAGLFGGKSEKTAGQPSAAGGGLKSISLDVLVKAAPFVFILGFATLIALGIHELVSPKLPTSPSVTEPRAITIAGSPEPVTLTVGRRPKPDNRFERRWKRYASVDLRDAQAGQWMPRDIDFYNLGSLFWLTAIGCLILSWRVDINDFSMHHFYKNRLVRCYLGASNPNRTAEQDPFTGFDEKDDLFLKQFAAHGVPVAQFAEQTYCGPYPILNGTLNLAGGSALAWQERKAASFVFTPLYCGYDKQELDRESGTPVEDDVRLSENGYTPTCTFANENGIHIGTAMAISGAAANPNAGYHTSTAVAFLLTLFNVRLGRWLGNPARFGKEDNHGPAFGLTYLITELFGLASADKAYVNVSDGGHFENLGIYELAKRSCRYIIVCDGEQDEGMKFEGLANAIRKCRTDLKVEIEIDVEQLRLKDTFSRAHCVVGRIKYPGDTRSAYLLYMKASLTGNEDTDVLQYHSTHPSFPHQSTGDQWFDESQFESYRKLGLHIVKSAFPAQSVLDDQDRPLADTYDNEKHYATAKAQLFSGLWETLYPPSDAIQKSFTKHADDYTKLVEAVAKGQNTAYLDDVIFNRWARLPLPKGETREGRYLCTAFQQLIENVYLDLDLDDPVQREHPHNAGWLDLFRKWAVSDAFTDAWDVAKPTYGKRFQKFYESLIAEECLRIAGTWEPRAPGGAVLPGLERIAVPRSPSNRGITGTATITKIEHIVRNGKFDGNDFVFQLELPGVGTSSYRLRLEEGDAAATLTSLGSDTPSLALRKV